MVEKITALNISEARRELAALFAARQAASAIPDYQLALTVEELYGQRQRKGLIRVQEIELKILAARLKGLLRG